jgi:hypothetical protein
MQVSIALAVVVALLAVALRASLAVPTTRGLITISILMAMATGLTWLLVSGMGLRRPLDALPAVAHPAAEEQGEAQQGEAAADDADGDGGEESEEGNKGEEGAEGDVTGGLTVREVAPSLPTCTVPVREGTMVVFSNYQMVHRVLRMVNHGCSTQEGDGTEGSSTDGSGPAGDGTISDGSRMAGGGTDCGTDWAWEGRRDFVALFVLDPAARPLVPAMRELFRRYALRKTLSAPTQLLRGAAAAQQKQQEAQQQQALPQPPTDCLPPDVVSLILDHAGIEPTPAHARRERNALLRQQLRPRGGFGGSDAVYCTGACARACARPAQCDRRRSDMRSCWCHGGRRRAWSSASPCPSAHASASHCARFPLSVGARDSVAYVQATAAT